MTDKIIAKKEDGIGWLTLNNPDRRNAISLEMWSAMAAALTDFETDDTVRVAVIRGAGGKAFASGADISQFEDQRKTAEQAELYAKASEAGRKKLEGFAKPMIAMIEGFCMGGGVLLAARADIRIAAENAIFGIPAGRLGLGYSYDSVVKLLEIVSPPVAREILLTARRFDAAWARQVGLVNMVVPVDALESEVRKMASEIAENAPLTLNLIKYAIAQVQRDPAARDMSGVEARTRACFDSEDYSEGRLAFKEKRKPVFKGR